MSVVDLRLKRPFTWQGLKLNMLFVKYPPLDYPKGDSFGCSTYGLPCLKVGEPFSNGSSDFGKHPPTYLMNMPELGSQVLCPAWMAKYVQICRENGMLEQCTVQKLGNVRSKEPPSGGPKLAGSPPRAPPLGHPESSVCSGPAANLTEAAWFRGICSTNLVSHPGSEIHSQTKFEPKVPQQNCKRDSSNPSSPPGFQVAVRSGLPAMLHLSSLPPKRR